MKIKDRTTTFIKTPEADHTWMRTNYANTACCVTQTVTVKQAFPTCPIQTPYGKINTTLFNLNYTFVSVTTIVGMRNPTKENANMLESITAEETFALIYIQANSLINFIN